MTMRSPASLALLILALAMGATDAGWAQSEARRVDDAAPAGPARAVLEIWPGGTASGPEAVAAASTPQIYERSADTERVRDRYVLDVTRPTLTVFEPEAPTGAAILLIPGGGYRWVVLDKEGYETAERFAAAGVTVFVLIHRLPGEGHAEGPDAPLADARAAMRLIRARAGEYGIDPGRVGVMGFSAGGHLAGSLATRFEAAQERPDFAILIYPVTEMGGPHVHAGSRRQLLGTDDPAPEQIARYSIAASVRADAPPAFLLHALDDASVPVENTLAVFEALRAEGVAVEMHLFAAGGHGFGLRYATGLPVAAWPDLVLAWMASRGLMTR